MTKKATTPTKTTAKAAPPNSLTELLTLARQGQDALDSLASRITAIEARVATPPGVVVARAEGTVDPTPNGIAEASLNEIEAISKAVAKVFACPAPAPVAGQAAPAGAAYDDLVDEMRGVREDLRAAVAAAQGKDPSQEALVASWSNLSSASFEAEKAAMLAAEWNSKSGGERVLYYTLHWGLPMAGIVLTFVAGMGAGALVGAYFFPASGGEAVEIEGDVLDYAQAS